MRLIECLCAFLAIAYAGTAIAEPDPGLAKDVAGPWRTPAFVARDAARHPVEELTFFGLKPDIGYDGAPRAVAEDTSAANAS